MPNTRNKPIKVAVLALGRSGWNIHIAGIRDDTRYKVVSVLDPDRVAFFL